MLAQPSPTEYVKKIMKSYKHGHIHACNVPLLF